MNKFFFIFCIIVFLFKTQTVFSNSLIYDVNNIEVSGKINNDLDKKKLIQAAFKEAFIIFVNKVLLRNDAANLYSTKVNIIEDLVFTYQITNHKKKGKKQDVLSVNIKFDQRKISNFFSQNGISYADVTNVSLTLLPVLIKDKDIFIFNKNFFYNNWLKSQNKVVNTNDILVSYNLALENIEDIQYINLNKENLSLIDVKKLTSLNHKKNYAFLLIYFTQDRFKAYVKTSFKNKEINKIIDLKVYPGNETKTYDEAIVNLKEEISQIWKGQNLIDVNTPSFLDLFLEVKQANNYLKLRSILDSLDLIENYSVLEMTDKYTKIRLKYRGKINILRERLLEKKISVKVVDNIWRIIVN